MRNLIAFIFFLSVFCMALNQLRQSQSQNNLMTKLVSKQLTSTSGDLTQYDEKFAHEQCAYALASYCVDKKLSSWNCGTPCNSYPGMVDVTIFHNKTGDSAGYGGYNSKSNEIVIAYRGTLPWDLKNWIDDIDFIKTKYPYCGNKCQVHEGFFKTYLNIRDQFQTTFTKLRAKYPSATVTVTGHSLGAAIATHCASDLIVNNKFTDFKLLTFGSPRVGDSDFAKWFKTQYTRDYYRVTRGHDPVPHLGLQAMGFQHTTQEVFYQQKTYRTCDPNNGEDPKCSNQYITDLDVLDHLLYMSYDFATIILGCQ